jgi:hypothetical protein
MPVWHKRMQHCRVSLRMVVKATVGLGACLMLAGTPNTGMGHAQSGEPPAYLPEKIVTEAYPGVCQPWVQVSQDGFGLTAGSLNVDTGGDRYLVEPYNSEEGFETVVFREQFYVGMEADNTLGARLWRTKAGVVSPSSHADWEEVAADPSGSPFGLADRAQNDHIDSLAVFADYLYASTANRSGSASGFRLYRSRTGNPGEWEEITARSLPGFGDRGNENFKDMQVFSGQLCGGTWNEQSGAQVWCSPDGLVWQQTNQGGFGDVDNIVIWSGRVFREALYVGVQNNAGTPQDASDDGGRIYRSGSLQAFGDWELVFEGEPGSYRAMLLGEFGGHLHASLMSPAGLLVYRSINGAAGTWEITNLPGFASQPGETRPENYVSVVDGAAGYADAFYLAVSNRSSGWELWRTSGAFRGSQRLLDWENVLPQPLTAVNQLYSVLDVFNGELYAWVTNYHAGQQVLRTRCPVCQGAAVDGAGVYRFDRLGVAIRLGTENLEHIEVCGYPDAVLDLRSTGQATRGYYQIATIPANVIYNAGVSLSYQPDELGPAAARQPLSLVQVDAGRELVCAPAKSTRTGEVACENSGSLAGTWTILAGVRDEARQPAMENAAWLALALLGVLFGVARWHASSDSK